MTRLAELEQRFSDLESQLKPSPERDALSILHAIIHEGWRRLASGPGEGAAAGPSIGNAAPSYDGQAPVDVANLYRSAPPMAGRAENTGLAVGTEAPDFTLHDAAGRAINLRDFRGHNLVLVFYPLDWSPACSDQLSLYQSELEEFAAYDTRVLGISVDSIYSHGAWAAVRGLSIPLLADFHPKGDIARRYSVWRETDGFSERAVYVLDRDGIIRYAQISPELHKVPDIYELFEHLAGLTRPAAEPGQVAHS